MTQPENTLNTLVNWSKDHDDLIFRTQGYGYGSTSRKVVQGPLLSHDMSLEQAIRRATQENLDNHTSAHHIQKPLWTLAEYCEHLNPETDDPKYEEIRFWLRSVEMVKRETWAEYEQRRKDQISRHPLYEDYTAAVKEYNATHDGLLCNADYQGTCCEACTEGDDDSGYHPEGCRRQETAREAYSDFWYANGVREDIYALV